MDPSVIFFRAARDLGMPIAPTGAAARDPYHATRQLTAARPLRLSDELRVRGGKKSRRRVARTWVPA